MVSTRAGHELWAKTKELFGMDERSLALFRICLGVTILFDLVTRMHDIKAHYTDLGVLPRVTVMEKFYTCR